MNRVGIFLKQMVETEVSGQTILDERSVDAGVRCPLLVRRTITGERIPRVERLIFEVEVGVSVECPDAASLDHFRPLTAATEAGTFRREHIIVDANQLRLR